MAITAMAKRTFYRSSNTWCKQASFAVSFVVLTREVPLHKFELVYREIVSRLSTAAGATGLRGLLTHWLDTLQPHLGEAPDAATRTARIEELAATLRGLEGMDLNFANGLIALVQNRFRPLAEGETPEAREAERQTLFEWFEGGRLSKKRIAAVADFRVVEQDQ